MISEHPKLSHLRKIADAMDSAFVIPGTKMRVGADGLIGLIPGIGDVFGLAVSSYFIFVAAQLNVSKAVLFRMFINVAIDSAIGAIPFLGDLFDFVWKSNRKNLSLLEKSLANPHETKVRSTGFVAVVVITVLTAVAAIVYVVIRALGWLVSQL